VNGAAQAARHAAVAHAHAATPARLPWYAGPRVRAITAAAAAFLALDLGVMGSTLTSTGLLRLVLLTAIAFVVVRVTWRPYLAALRSSLHVTRPTATSSSTGDRDA
jgi:hypothetical protein